MRYLLARYCRLVYLAAGNDAAAALAAFELWDDPADGAALVMHGVAGPVEDIHVTATARVLVESQETHIKAGPALRVMAGNVVCRTLYPRLAELTPEADPCPT